MNEKYGKIIIVIITVLILGGVFLLLQPQDTAFFGLFNSSQEETKVKQIQIGASLALSGKTAEYGQSVREGMELAIEELNNKNSQYKYVLNLEDTTGETQKAVSSVQKMINIDNVKIVFNIASNDLLALAPITEEHKVILFSPVSASEKVSTAGDYLFRNRETGIITANRMVTFLNEIKINKLGIIYAKSANSVTYAEAISNKFKEINKEVILAEYLTEATSHKTEILKILENDVEAIYVSGATEADATLIVKQLKEMGYNKIITGGTAFDTPSFLENTSGTAEGVFFTSPAFDITNPNISEYRKAYLNKFGKDSAPWAANAYDGVMVIAKGIEYCNGDENTSCIRDYLYSVKNYPGVGGKFSFDANGDVDKEVIIKTVKNGVATIYETKQESKEPIKIGVIIPLSGAVTSFYGEPISNGLDLALNKINNSEEINNQNIELIYEDSAGDTKQGITAYQKLINLDKTKIILSATSNVGLGIAPLAENDQIILMSIGSASSKLSEAGDYIFRHNLMLKDEVKFMSNYFKNNNISNIGILSVNAEVGTSYLNSFLKEYNCENCIIKLNENYKKGNTDFRTQLQKLKSLNIDSVYFIGYPAELGLIINQSKQLGMELKYYSINGIGSTDLIDIAKENANGLIYTDFFDPNSKTNEFKEFYQNYVNKYNQEPNSHSALAYDALLVISTAISNCEDSTNTNCIKNELYKIKNYSGATGQITFDSNGDTKKEVILKTISNGKFVKYEAN